MNVEICALAVFVEHGDKGSNERKETVDKVKCAEGLGN
jgi:hypothetical protein